MILGTNFLSKTDIKLDYDRGEMLWYDNMLPMRPRRGLTSEDFDHMEDSYFIQHEDEFIGQDWLKLYATEILNAKYKKINITLQHIRNATCWMYSNVTRNSLTALLVSTPIGKSTSKLNLMQDLCTCNHTPCLEYICPHSNAN